MEEFSTRPKDRIEYVLERYGSMLFRFCCVMLQNESDGEDAVQETLIRYLKKAPPFRDPEHEKAWLLKTAANHCRDVLRFRTRHPQAGLEELRENAGDAPEENGIWEALQQLPAAFRTVLYLHYVEGYTTGEIAKMIGKTPSAVKMRLVKGRALLGEAYRKEYV